jgi:hypothetical protein
MTLCSLALSAAHAQAPPSATNGTALGQLAAEERPKATEGKSADDWRLAFTVYGWATNLSGSATVRGNTADIHASVIDLIQKSDSLAAFDGYVEANKGRFGLYGDVVWAKLGIPTSAATYRNPIAGLQLSVAANAAITTSLLILEGGVVGEVAKWPGGEASYTAVDVLGGVRYWNISTQINLDVTGAINFSDPRFSSLDRSRTIAVADSGTLQWVDPLIGLRVRHQFTPHQQISARGDIGGFGLPGSSLFSWQLVGIYSYTWQFSGYSLSATGGYRALATNVPFNTGPNSSSLDLVIHGPLIGLTVRF